MDTVKNQQVIMVKKRLASGEPCRKCAQAEDMLRRRGLWDRITEIVWADESDPSSPGWELARRHGVDTAPFFVVGGGGDERVYRSALKLVKQELTAGSAARGPAAAPSGPPAVQDLADAASALEGRPPAEAIRWVLERHGRACAIAFSGAEDVVLIDLAAATGLPFEVFCLDTGRLHPETYEFVERVRDHYGVAIEMVVPDPEPLQDLVRKKGLFSFYRDGHKECCGIRKVAPLERTLRGYRAWITGQRRDQNEATRAGLPVVEPDPRFSGSGGGDLVKVNPLATWTASDVWRHIHDRELPYNPLFARGYRSIGCAPCTRPVAPGQPDRAGRWWWEHARDKECGLHTGTAPPAPPEPAAAGAEGSG